MNILCMIAEAIERVPYQHVRFTEHTPFGSFDVQVLRPRDFATDKRTFRVYNGSEEGAAIYDERGRDCTETFIDAFETLDAAGAVYA